MISLITSIIGLLIIAGISKSVMDTLNFRYSISVFSSIPKTSWLYYWLNSSDVTWVNKYKNRDPKLGPAFIGSTTWLVWVTDGWHFFQMIMLSCYHLIIALLIANLFNELHHSSILELSIITSVSFIIIKLIASVVFEFFWSLVFVKR